MICHATEQSLTEKSFCKAVNGTVVWSSNLVSIKFYSRLQCNVMIHSIYEVVEWGSHHPREEKKRERNLREFHKTVLGLQSCLLMKQAEESTSTPLLLLDIHGKLNKLQRKWNKVTETIAKLKLAIVTQLKPTKNSMQIYHLMALWLQQQQGAWSSKTTAEKHTHDFSSWASCY